MSLVRLSARRAALACTMTLMLFACDSPTAPTPAAAPEEVSVARKPIYPLGWVNTAAGSTTDGSGFSGTITITKFFVDDDRQLWVEGTINGTITTATGTLTVAEPFSAPATLARNLATAAAAGAITQQAENTGTCDILFLDLGPLHLDLLGLTVDLAPVVLDINAEPGGGNLLGNLLCAVLGLFDGAAAIAAISQLLDSITNLISALP